jgi:acylphosphatase
METTRLHAVVRGDVQGVGFRWFVQRVAVANGVQGWVANRPDGSVECLAEGPRQDLQRLLEALRRGPGGAQVEMVDASWEKPRGEFRGFAIVG